jgi:hypothetical protein
MNRLERAVRDVVTKLFPGLDFQALYPATVKGQNSDGTLELVPDDVRFSSHSKVPLRLGVPGLVVKVPANGRVLLGFEGGDPRRPVATLWGDGGVTEITINADVIKLAGGGTAGTPVAKEGSATQGHVHIISGTAGPFPLSATAATATDSIATGAGSASVKVP